MRIAIVGLSIETMLSSPVLIEWDAVQHYGSSELVERDVWMVRGMLARLQDEPDATAVPLYWATALPGGALRADAYARIKSKTLALLSQNGPFDGVLVVNHGALEVEGFDVDADTDYVESVRRLVGPAVPIGVALDLHGDMTPGLLRAATIFSVLRTAPHRDDQETGFRAADQLIRVITEKLAPRKAAVRIPMLIPGEIAVTTASPGLELYGSLPSYDATEGMLEANILTGFAWNDRAWTVATALAVSVRNVEVARRTALDLAARIWAKRAEFVLRMETASVEDGLKRAMRSAARPVYLSDSGDNTTAGAPGDLTLVLQAAVRDPTLEDLVIAGVTAPETVARLIVAGIGAETEIEIGSEHISRPKGSIRVMARVEACGSTLELGGFQPYSSIESAWARARIGAVTVTFHARPIGVTTPHHLTAMGIDPLSHRAYVVKLGYLHPQLEDIAARHILLASDGLAQLDLAKLNWSALPRPTFPLERDFVWVPESGLYDDQQA